MIISILATYILSSYLIWYFAFVWNEPDGCMNFGKALFPFAPIALPAMGILWLFKV